MISYLVILFCFLAVFSGFMMITIKNPVHAILYLILVFCNVSFILLLLGIEFIAVIFLVVYVGAIAVLFLFVVMMLNIKIIELHETFWRYLPVGILLTGLLFCEFIYFIFGGELFKHFFSMWFSSFDFLIISGVEELFINFGKDYWDVNLSFRNNSLFSKYFHFSSLFINSNFVDSLYIKEIFLLNKENLNSFFSYYSNLFVYNENKSNVELLGWLFYTYFFSCFFILGLILLIAMIGSIVLILNQNLNIKKQYIFNQISKNASFAVSLKKKNY